MREAGPPRLALYLVRVCASRERRAEVEGDLRELYRRIADRHGRPRAALRCWREIILCTFWRVRSRPGVVTPPKRTGEAMEALVQDARYALRSLLRTPGFTLIAVGTLALGIGANIALFSAVYGVLWRPLGIPEAERVVYLFQRNDEAGEQRQGAAPETFQFWLANANSLQAVGAWIWTSATLEHPDGAEELDATLMVGGDFFDVLGVPPLHGRALRPDDEVPGRSGSVVVLGHDVWQRRFGADPEIVGRIVVLDGVPYTVVGIMPDGLQLPHPDVDAWIPRGFAVEERALIGRLNVAARLVPDVQTETAQAEMVTLANRLADVSPNVHRGWTTDVVPVREDLVGGSRTGLLLGLGAVGLVLLMACVNVANLLFARAVTRRRELALRSALGASRTEIVRLVLLESSWIASIGGAVGIATAALMHSGLVRLASGILPRIDDIRLDWPVLLFGVVLSLAAGMVFGVAPAFHAARRNPMTALRESAGAGAGRRAHTVRAGMVGLQVALALPMLVGAGLLVQSLRELQRVDPGFDPRGVTAARLYLDGQSYPDADSRRMYFGELLERLRALPGVTAAGAVSGLPLDPVGIDFSSPLVMPSQDLREGESRPRADHRVVTPGYLEAIGLPLIAGRFLDATDRDGAPRAIVVNETLANQLWPEEDAVGRRVSVPFFGMNEYTVIGVVGDVRFRGLSANPRPEIYTAHEQGPFGSMTVAVRTDGDAESLTDAIRRSVLALDARQPVHSIVIADQLVAGAMSVERFSSAVSSLFAIVALALAGGGLYGVMAYAVRQRTREIGVLLALGAPPRRVTAQIVRRGLVIAGAGAAAGTLLAIAATRTLQGAVYGVSRVDPVIFVVVIGILLSAVLIASYVPARHAARIDPVRALREE